MAKTADKTEKRSFILYTQHREQVNMLTNEQAGELLKAVYEYADTGEAQVTDPMVSMMLAFLRQQMDIDRKRYEETCEKRREAGKKGGRPKTAKQQPELLPEYSEEPNGFTRKHSKAKKADNENEYDNDNVNGNDYDNENQNWNDVIPEDYYDCSNQKADAKSMPETAEGFTRYGREQYLTTAAELQKMQALADELLYSYRGKKATPDDCEKVFGYVHTLGVTDTGEHYGIYSEKKADLLRHVFEQASLRSDMSWQYISRIYSNYDKNRVTNVEEAIAYETAWNRGEIA